MVGNSVTTNRHATFIMPLFKFSGKFHKTILSHTQDATGWWRRLGGFMFLEKERE